MQFLWDALFSETSKKGNTIHIYKYWSPRSLHCWWSICIPDGSLTTQYFRGNSKVESVWSKPTPVLKGPSREVDPSWRAVAHQLMLLKSFYSVNGSPLHNTLNWRLFYKCSSQKWEPLNQTLKETSYVFGRFDSLSPPPVC